jgi:hypothetical protein
VQKIQLDLSSHPVKNLLSEKVRLGKIEIIKDRDTDEEQISIDFSVVQQSANESNMRKGSIISIPAYSSLN